VGSVATQEDLALSLGISENAHKLNGLVEDIRDALMDYQVCSLERHVLAVANNICSDFAATGHIQGGLSTDSESLLSYGPILCINLRI